MGSPHATVNPELLGALSTWRAWKTGGASVPNPRILLGLSKPSQMALLSNLYRSVPNLHVPCPWNRLTRDCLHDASFPRNPVADSSLIASSPSESSSNHDAGHVTSKRNVGVTRSRTVTAIRYRCPDNHDEDRDAEDVLLGRIGRISTFEGKDIDISEVLTS